MLWRNSGRKISDRILSISVIKYGLNQPSKIVIRGDSTVYRILLESSDLGALQIAHLCGSTVVLSTTDSVYKVTRVSGWRPFGGDICDLDIPVRVQDSILSSEHPSEKTLRQILSRWSLRPSVVICVGKSSEIPIATESRLCKSADVKYIWVEDLGELDWVISRVADDRTVYVHGSREAIREYQYNKYISTK